MKSLKICVADKSLADALQAVLAAQDMTAHQVHFTPLDNAPAAAPDLYIGPARPDLPPGTVIMHPRLRMGMILDRLRRLAASSSGAESIAIGPYRLLVDEALLRQDGTEDIRLTEKERDILVALHDLAGGVMERRTLLAHVWGYAAESETHTVETHIYRLRQKIEKDPAAPEILLTDENGYRLGDSVA